MKAQLALALVLLVGACSGCEHLPGSGDGGKVEDLTAGRDLPGSSDLACASCSQADPNACGGTPSYCSCFPGPACCCKGSG